MYFYLAMVGFEPTPTSTAAPINSYSRKQPSSIVFPIHIIKHSLQGISHILEFVVSQVIYV